MTTHTFDITFIDHDPSALESIRQMLRSRPGPWRVHTAQSACEGLELAGGVGADLIVCALDMPASSGFDLLDEVARHPTLRSVPVVMLVDQEDAAQKRRALDRGALDFLTKPVRQEDLIARLTAALRVRECEVRLRAEDETLERRVRERRAQSEFDQTELIWRLARAGEVREGGTGDHVSRVAHCSLLLAQQHALPEADARAIFSASPLHDIGKAGLPDAVIRKAGILTPHERRIMETHCRIGLEILSGPLDIPTPRNVDNRILRTAAEIAFCHHERWDGSGYPCGLAGDAIPIAARIVAIADVLDALCSDRPYRPALEFREAVAEIHRGFGSHFDPGLRDAFDASRTQLEWIVTPRPRPLVGDASAA